MASTRHDTEKEKVHWLEVLQPTEVAVAALLTSHTLPTLAVCA